MGSTPASGRRERDGDRDVKPAGRTTNDALFGGALLLAQPERGEGYRVNVDALLLAREALLGPQATGAVDLGAGVGAVGLSLLLGGAGRVALVERDPWMAALARVNAAPFGPRASVIEAPVEELGALEPADLVVCNPPFTPPGRGPAPPEARRSGARHGETAPFLQAAARLLSEAGRACFIYPAGELEALLEALAPAGLALEALRAVHPSPRSAARVVIAQLALATAARRALGRPARCLSPWFERDERGQPERGLAAFVAGATL